MTEHDEPRLVSAVPVAPVEAPLLGRAAWLRILPFGTYLVFIVAADLLARAGVPATTLRWLYPLKIGAVALLLALCWRHYHELHRARLRAGPALAAGAAGVLVFVLWIGLDAPWMSIGTPAGYDPRDAGQIDWRLAAVRVAGAALVVPIMEELFWRGFLMRWIVAPNFEQVDPAQLGLRAFVITIVLFGVEHNLWLAGMVAGLAYGALYRWHRTLWSPVLAHGVTNGLLGGWVLATGNWSYW